MGRLYDLATENVNARELKDIVDVVPTLLNKLQAAADKIVSLKTTYPADSAELDSYITWFKGKLTDLNNRY